MCEEFETLKYDSAYEIMKSEPHYIRKIGKTKYIKECVSKAGYVTVNIHGNKTLLHRILAFQFIPNEDPENKIQVDHINRIRNDNRIDNLRWVTISENRNNSKKQESCIRQEIEYLEQMPDKVYEIKEYNGLKFKNYFFDYENDRLLKLQNSGKIKLIKPETRVHRLGMIDINGEYHKYCIKKFFSKLKSMIDE